MASKSVMKCIRRANLLGVVPPLFVALLLSWDCSIVSAQFSEAGVQEFITPVEAPDFTLKDSSGREVSLQDLKGKVVLLNFFTTW
jgi:cytochrome c biogenesis protein CcmG/thiol:disulfide interchange protein DsbE